MNTQSYRVYVEGAEEVRRGPRRQRARDGGQCFYAVRRDAQRAVGDGKFERGDRQLYMLVGLESRFRPSPHRVGIGDLSCREGWVSFGTGNIFSRGLSNHSPVSLVRNLIQNTDRASP